MLKLQLKMITYSALIVLLFIILSYLYQNQADATVHTVSRPGDSLRIVRMQLQGLRPESANDAYEAFSEVPGVVLVRLSPGEKQATIQLDIERTSIRQMNQTLRKSGFTPIF